MLGLHQRNHRRARCYKISSPHNVPSLHNQHALLLCLLDSCHGEGPRSQRSEEEEE